MPQVIEDPCPRCDGWGIYLLFQKSVDHAPGMIGGSFESEDYMEQRCEDCNGTGKGK